MAETATKRRKKGGEIAKAMNSAGWIFTFADLMSLLMAFFVMLLALSEVDKAKFEQLGISMKVALGSPITAALNNSTKPNPYKDQAKSGKTDNNKLAESSNKIKPLTQTQKDAMALAEVLHDHIVQKKVEVESKGEVIIVRMLDSGVFKSGAAQIKDSFKPILAKMSQALKEMKGEIIVSGHTDDIPIDTTMHRSNWELSADRAYSVIAECLKDKDVPKNRFILQGFGDTRPLKPNTNPENRAQNRRVEMRIDQTSTTIKSMQDTDITKSK